MTPNAPSRALFLAQILWPAFLAAALLEMVVFSWVDPASLQMGDWQPDRKTVYSVGFLVFWAACSVSSLISLWFRDADMAVQASREASLAARDDLPGARRPLPRHRSTGHRHA
ncbi:MAG: hypothetical protein RI907_2298 [Pseudomonadota bacterium]|jgi:thiol:disulfide interchange protein